MTGTSLRRRGALAMALSAAIAPAARANALTIAGTGGPLAAFQALADGFVATGGPPWTVHASLGSAGGLRALAAGRIGLALSLGAPGPEHAATLRSRVVARTALVLAAHRHCGVGEVTPDRAARMLRGDERYWETGMQARLVTRPPGEREWRALRDGPAPLPAVLDAPPRQIGEIVAQTSQENGQAIAGIEGAFGLITLGQILSEGLDVRILGFDQHFPTLAGLRDGTWPMGLDIHLSHRADAPAAALAFVAFLASPEAARILARSGYLATGGHA